MFTLWKPTAAGLFMGFILATTAGSYAQTMEGTYVGLSKITRFDSNGKKYKEAVETILEISSDNTFTLYMLGLTYDGHLVAKGKTGAMTVRNDTTNINYRCKLQPGKGLSGTAYMVDPLSFEDIKFKFTRLDDK